MPQVGLRNPDGTYNGVKAMAAMSGLSEDEVIWTFNRIKHLIFSERKTAQQAKDIVREEAKSKPWEKTA